MMKIIGIGLLAWCLFVSVTACFFLVYVSDISAMSDEQGFQCFVGLFLSIGGIVGSVVGIKYISEENK